MRCPLPAALTLTLAMLLLPATLRAQTYLDADISAPADFPLAGRTALATLLIDPAEDPGVTRAAKDLQADLHRVTSRDAALVTSADHLAGPVVIIGTVGKSPLLDALAASGKIDLAPLKNKWESSFLQTVQNPFPNVPSALVIAGSDKRGTIFGIYDLSQTIGVSPWYFWADVPPQHHDLLSIKPGIYRQGEPSVKYRGIFINDEAPDLTNWVREHHGSLKDFPSSANYNHEFYAHVFELLLRLKANYLWPAMWNNAFNEDDPENPRLADEYGIVMGTSHQEPMLRAQKEWDHRHPKSWNYYTDAPTLQAFWKEGVARNKNFESILTIGLRGANDTPMIPDGTRDQSMALLKDIVAVQRKIITDTLNPDPAKVPQLWCPYKEVLEYYNAGLRVPDDVTLLWTDDNWGNIRRLPTPDERSRPGGAGIYYHFDYVGGPRNYKWLNTNPLPRIWQQMSLAKESGADRIWIVNVGHLKGLELPIDYFMHLAWNTAAYSPANSPDPTRQDPQRFTRNWAAAQFGPQHAAEIADLLSTYGRYIGRRKPELLEPTTYSLIHFHEADSVVTDWNALAAKAQTLSEKLPPAQHDAFYELVLFPIKANANLNALYVAAGKNALYAQQGRPAANDFAREVADRFQADANLMNDYNHTLAAGKWNHFMDQVHIGYTTWQDPARNTAPRTVTVTPLSAPSLGIALEGSVATWPSNANTPAALPPVDIFNRQQRTIDLFNRGTGELPFTATADQPFVHLSATSGTLAAAEQRLLVDIDWPKTPTGHTTATLTITSGSTAVPISLDLFNPADITPESLDSYVQSADGIVSLEAQRASTITPTNAARWAPIDNDGRTFSGMTILPLTAPSTLPPNPAPTLEYRVYLFDTANLTLTTILSPTLNTAPDRGLRFAAAFDDQPPTLITAIPQNYNASNGNRDWETTVKNNARTLSTPVPLANPAPGYHILKITMVDPGVVIQKLILSPKPLPPTYLGPPPSFLHASH